MVAESYKKIHGLDWHLYQITGHAELKTWVPDCTADKETDTQLQHLLQSRFHQGDRVQLAPLLLSIPAVSLLWKASAPRDSTNS
jgi:hypothetical protein